MRVEIDRRRSDSCFKGGIEGLPADGIRPIVLEFDIADASRPHHVPRRCSAWTRACSVLPG